MSWLHLPLRPISKCRRLKEAPASPSPRNWGINPKTTWSRRITPTFREACENRCSGKWGSAPQQLQAKPSREAARMDPPPARLERLERLEVSQFPELYAVPAAMFVGLYAAGSYYGYMDLAGETQPENGVRAREDPVYEVVVGVEDHF